MEPRIEMKVLTMSLFIYPTRSSICKLDTQEQEMVLMSEVVGSEMWDHKRILWQTIMDLDKIMSLTNKGNQEKDWKNWLVLKQWQWMILNRKSCTATISNSSAQRDSTGTQGSLSSSRGTRLRLTTNMWARILSVWAHNSSHIWWIRTRVHPNQAPTSTSSQTLWLHRMGISPILAWVLLNK